MALLNNKLNQQDMKHSPCHQSKKRHKIVVTGSPAKGKQRLAKVQTGDSDYVQMRDAIKAISIGHDSKSNEEHEQELKQQPMDKHLVVKTDQNEGDKEENDVELKDDNMPHISQESVDGYLLSVIGHLVDYT